jgi:uncharacterized protein DUF5818
VRIVAKLAILIFFAATTSAAMLTLESHGSLGGPSADTSHPRIRTFPGTITKNGDQFVLSDAKTRRWYELDDQNVAARFEGKSVTVTGTLDVVKNIIRIQSIAEAAT